MPDGPAFDDCLADLLNAEEDFCALQFHSPFDYAQRRLIEAFAAGQLGAEWVGIWLPFEVAGESGSRTAQGCSEPRLFVAHYSRYFESRADANVAALLERQVS